MFDEIRLLVIEDSVYVLGVDGVDEQELLHEHRIGSMAIAFANADLSYLADLSRYRQELIRRLSIDSSVAVSNPGSIQTVVMALIALLDDNFKEFWFFEIERAQLRSIDEKLDRSIFRKEDLIKEFTKILSRLEALVQFQEELKNLLTELSCANKKDSGHASSAQILCRLFKVYPDICCYCLGETGYTIVDVDDRGVLRAEMLNRRQSNAFRAILEPESGLLGFNDIKDNKIICEYHILTEVKMWIMFDLIEGLRRSDFVARCSTCKTFFFSSDKRVSYCANEVCRSSVARMRKRKGKIHSDPFLEQAFRYKNAMYARYRRTNDATCVNSSNKNVSHEELEIWSILFHEELNNYEQKKAEAILQCAPQEELDGIGEEFLDRVRPEGYVAYKNSKKAPV